MAELLTELKKGMASFTLIGEAKVSSDTFKGLIQPKEGSYWMSVRSSIPFEIESGVRIYADVNDGYQNNNPIIKRMPAERGDEFKMVEFPYKDRLDEKIIEKVAKYELFRGNLEKDKDGKPIMATFVHGIDFERYLAKHLVDGMSVKVRGNVEYSPSKDRENVYRNYRIKSVFLNEGYEKNGETVDPLPHSATMEQTYFVEAGALDKRWEKDLEGRGKTMVAAHVADYVGKLWDGSKYVQFKKTVALPQAINIVVGDTSDEKALKRAKILAKKLFDVPKKKVRQISLVIKINEGFETGTPDIVVDKDLQALIDEGLMTMEDVTDQVTVRGNRVSELLLVRPRVKINDEGKTVIEIDDDRFSPDVLIFPELETSESEVFEDKDTGGDDIEKAPDEGMGDDEFNALFGD